VITSVASLVTLSSRPSQLLAAAAGLAGRDLDAGDIVLTGTPPGVALKVPRWKRRLGELMLDRFGKLDAAIDMYAHGAGFLRPGDQVEVDAGFLGTRTVTIDLGARIAARIRRSSSARSCCPPSGRSISA